MSDEDIPEEPYEIGYGKPPKHGQWKKGQSGNPSGKKKKKVSLLDQLKSLAEKEIVVQQNGLPMTMTQAEAMLAAVFHKAMKGDLGSIKFISQALGISEAELPAQTAPPFTEDLLSVLETHADWMGVVETARAELAENIEDQEDEGNDDVAY